MQMYFTILLNSVTVILFETLVSGILNGCIS